MKETPDLPVEAMEFKSEATRVGDQVGEATEKLLSDIGPREVFEAFSKDLTEWATRKVEQVKEKPGDAMMTAALEAQLAVKDFAETAFGALGIKDNEKALALAAAAFPMMGLPGGGNPPTGETPTPDDPYLMAKIGGGAVVVLLGLGIVGLGISRATARLDQAKAHDAGKEDFRRRRAEMRAGRR